MTDERPIYRLLEPFFGPDCNLYPEGDTIVFDDEPNENMQPLNEAAKVKQKAFFDKLDECARKSAEKAGREYAGRPRSLDDAITLATEEARAIQRVADGPGVALMKATPKTADRVGRAEPPPAPETAARGRGASLHLNG